MFCMKFDEGNKVWRSNTDTPSAFSPNVSFAHLLLKSMEIHGSKIAQISDDTGERFTFEEIRMKTIRAAQNLQLRGYTSKQVISIIAGNVAHLAPIVFAAFCLGCPMNPLHTSIEKQLLVSMLPLTEPGLIFCDAIVYDLVVECLAELGNNAKVFTFNGTKGDSEAVENLFKETGTEEDFLPVEVDGINEIALIMSTSGSTGPSKGVCLSNAYLISVTENMIEFYSNGIHFNPSTIYWLDGLFCGICLGTIGGSTRIISNEPFSVELQLRIIRDYKVTILDNVSYYLLLMLKSGLLVESELASLKSVIVSGCKIPFSVRQEFNSYLPNGNVHDAYGLTELGLVSIDFPKFCGKDSVGRLVNVGTVKIVDEDGNRCGINVAGEICVKSRHKFLGYYKNKKLTDEAMDSEGYFKTGDIGHIDEDGYVYIADRKKNIIDCGDGWVFPSEIEEVLLKSPEIERVCAVGVPADEVLELPAAVVVRVKGSSITEEDICKMVEDNLPRCCRLEGGVYFVDSIGVTATGKPLLREAKAIATKLYKAKSEQSTNDNDSSNVERAAAF